MWEHASLGGLRIFSRKTLVTFWQKHADAERPLRLWFATVRRATWSGPADVRLQFGSADFLAGDRVIFNIKGNDYRLIVQIRYRSGSLFIRFIGTHRAYDRIDASEV